MLGLVPGTHFHLNMHMLTILLMDQMLCLICVDHVPVEEGEEEGEEEEEEEHRQKKQFAYLIPLQLFNCRWAEKKFQTYYKIS